MQSPPIATISVSRPKWIGSLWIRALLPGTIAASSVWVVAALAGVVGAGADDDRDLVVRIEQRQSDDLHSNNAHQEVLYSSVAFNTFLTVRPLGISSLETDAPADSWDKDLSGGAGIVVNFWTDKDFKVPARVGSTTSPTLHLKIIINRELQEEVRIEKQPKFIFAKSSQQESGISQFKGVAFYYEVDCRLSSDAQVGEGRDDQRILQYGCPVRFKKPLNAAKGFAQFDWTQTLQVVESKVNTRLISTVRFDPEYYDARVSPFDDLDFAPTVTFGVHSRDFYSHASAKAQITHIAPKEDAMDIDKMTWKTHPAGFSIHGVNSKKKDFVDLLSFIMAAWFGAAIASLTEFTSAALRRKSGEPSN